MQKCWEVRKCPASLYLICEGYKRGLNCWEIKSKPCCKRSDFERCKVCKIYIRCTSESE